MTTRILADVAASITEFKANPMKLQLVPSVLLLLYSTEMSRLSTASLQAPTRS